MKISKILIPFFTAADALSVENHKGYSVKEDRRPWMSEADEKRASEDPATEIMAKRNDFLKKLEVSSHFSSIKLAQKFQHPKTLFQKLRENNKNQLIRFRSNLEFNSGRPHSDRMFQFQRLV